MYPPQPIGMHWHPNSPGRQASLLLGQRPSHIGTSAPLHDVGVGIVVVELVELVVLVVEEVEEVVVNIVELVVLVEASQGQLGKKGGGLPMATFKQTSASVDVMGAELLSSQIHSGLHMVMRRAAFSMKRQSVEAGEDPPVIGCPQSPWALQAVAGTPAEDKSNTRAAPAPKIEVSDSNFFTAIGPRLTRFRSAKHPEHGDLAN
jgi:hypothetical protein